MRSCAWGHWAFTLACAVFFTLVVGCDGAATTRYVPLAQLAARMASVQCKVRTQCTGRPLEVTDQDCLSQTTARLQSTLVGEIADAVVRNTALYDERKAADCIDELNNAACARFETLLPPSCLAAVGGRGTTGTPCVSEFDCSAAHFCSVGDKCPGACQPRGQDGTAACSDDRACAEGLRCPDIGGTCAVPLAPGARCELFAKPCAFGFSCFAPTIVDPGTCEPVVSNWSRRMGQTCVVLAGLFCAPDLSCPFFAIQEDELPLCQTKSLSGGACVVSVPDPCPATEFCQGSILEGTGTCTPRVARAAPCLSSRECSFGDVCDGGLCGPRQALGAVCMSEAGCWSRSCVDGVCVNPNLCR